VRAKKHYHELIALLHAAVAASCRAGAFLPAGNRTLAGAVTQQLAEISTPHFSLKQEYKNAFYIAKTKLPIAFTDKLLIIGVLRCRCGPLGRFFSELQTFCFSIFSVLPPRKV